MHRWGSWAVCHPHTEAPTVPASKLHARRGRQLHSNVVVHFSNPQLRPTPEFEGQHCCTGSMHWPAQSTLPVQQGKHGKRMVRAPQHTNEQTGNSKCRSCHHAQSCMQCATAMKQRPKANYGRQRPHLLGRHIEV